MNEENKYAYTWPMAIDTTKPDLGAVLIDANALIHIFQDDDLDAYYDKQYDLVKKGLEDGALIIKDEVVVLSPARFEATE